MVLLGNPYQLRAALDHLTTRLRQVGLAVNLRKCELWGPGAGQVHAECPEMALKPWVPSSGVTILGCPVSYPGSSAFQEEAWQTCVDRLGQATARVTGLTDAQLAHHLLRQSLDSCRVNHLLRATDCYQQDGGLRQAEDIILEAFADLLGCSLPPAAKVQAGLPLSAGGCGLKCPLATRPAARLSALCAFYSEGASRIGLPAYASQIRAAWIQPVLQEMQSMLGSNFDPLPRWLGHLESICSAEGPPTRQH